MVNTPINVVTLLIRNNNFNWGYFIFGIIPFFIAIIGLIFAFVKKNTQIILLSIIAGLTLLIMIIASSLGKLVLITKYTMEIYPIFIAIVAFGLYSIKPNALRRFLIFSFFGLILIYLGISEYAPQKIQRSEGHKLVADLILDANLNKNDKILLFGNKKW